jgi:hypothetical protein
LGRLAKRVASVISSSSVGDHALAAGLGGGGGFGLVGGDAVGGR